MWGQHGPADQTNNQKTADNRPVYGSSSSKISSNGLHCLSAPLGILGPMYATETLKTWTVSAVVAFHLFIYFRTSVFLNLHEGAELQGLRDRSGGKQFSRMKEQLDVMNIAAPFAQGPGRCFWYSYRHTAGTRLNKHWGSVTKKNLLTSRSGSSAASVATRTAAAISTQSVSFSFFLFFSPPICMCVHHVPPTLSHNNSNQYRASSSEDGRVFCV